MIDKPTAFGSAFTIIPFVTVREAANVCAKPMNTVKRR